ncbi:MAG: hypothetical protein AB1742_06625, partial [bacterium]
MRKGGTRRRFLSPASVLTLLILAALPELARVHAGSYALTFFWWRLPVTHTLNAALTGAALWTAFRLIAVPAGGRAAAAAALAAVSLNYAFYELVVNNPRCLEAP